MKKIAFVCTGNTCRSPMAEVIAKDIFKKRKINIDVISRGIAVYFPSEASENSEEVVKQYGLDLSNHKAMQITKEDIESCDFIFTMTYQHREFVKKLSPESSDKVFTLKEYVKANGDDISDPYGGDIELYRHCAEQLHSFIDMLADLFQ